METEIIEMLKARQEYYENLSKFEVADAYAYCIKLLKESEWKESSIS